MQVRVKLFRPGLGARESQSVFRAIGVPLTGGHQRPSGAAVIVGLVALGLDVEVDRIRNPLVSPASLMLVDQRRTLTVMTNSRHQIRFRW